MDKTTKSKESKLQLSGLMSPAGKGIARGNIFCEIRPTVRTW